MSSADGFNPNTKKGAEKSYYGVPGVRDIADILYGLESNGGITIVDKNGKSFMQNLAAGCFPVFGTIGISPMIWLWLLCIRHLCLRHIKSGITGSGF